MKEKLPILQIKINCLKEKYGLNTFSCQEKDLRTFTLEELQTLNNRGLINNIMYHKELLNRDNK